MRPLSVFQPSLSLLSLLLFLLPLSACSSDQEAADADVPVTFEQAHAVLATSCMPCHNRQTLPQVLEKVRLASFSEIDGESRLRIINELESLLAAILSGSPLDYSSAEHLQQNFQGMPGEFYNVLEKGVMPPSWAPELMRQIQWSGYTPLTPANRVLLLRFAKPASQKYLR